MKTVSHLLTELIAPPPPTKLAEVLLSDDFPLSSLPNVKIFPERLRPLDKERMIGRLSPGQEEILYEKAKIARGEVPEMEMESYRYPFEKSDYA